MKLLQPVGDLVLRPAVFLLLVVAMLSGSMVLLLLRDPDVPGTENLDIVLIACVGYCGLMGAVAGAAVRELQSSTFAWLLPRVSWAMGRAFLFFGASFSLIVAVIITAIGTEYDPLFLVALGVASFCFGSAYHDPVRRWMSVLNTAVALTVLVASVPIGRFCHAQPVLVTVLTVPITVFYLRRLLAESTFRHRLVRPTTPLPGAFALTETIRRERKKRLTRGRAIGWSTSLTAPSWHWLRAAAYESYGARGWSSLLRALPGIWPVAVLLVLHAYLDRGTDALPLAIAKATYDTLFRAPHLTPYGDGGPYFLLIIWISAAGAFFAFRSPVALRTGLLYPLARADRARLAFRGGLIDCALFAIALGVGFYIVGSLAGWLAHHELRADFVPFFARVVFITIIFLPFVQYFRVHAETGAFQRHVYASALVIVGCVAFVTIVLIAVVVRIPMHWALESVSLALGVAVSQWLYRSKLNARFAQADLV